MRSSMNNSANSVTESRFLGSLSASSIRNFLPRSLSSKNKPNSSFRISRSNSENTPPIDPNIAVAAEIHGKASAFVAAKESSSKMESQPELVQPSDAQTRASVNSDPPVKVFVRIRPRNGGEREKDGNVKKLSQDTVLIGERKLTYDSVFDSKSSQEEVFQCVGVPLVRNALAGYNTSIISHGQSGSGKTYTMWGPPSAMVDDPSPCSHQGIVPRVFQMLFSEIEKEQKNSEGKQINFQCRCSFLEVYNEKIGDLLDQTQRNLEIKDDPRNGLYVENLTEEYVTGYDDVMQILIKGLSSRKVGATSVNSKSSRSHIVFTFIIESWSKGTLSKNFGSSKISKMSFVDLAGLDRKKVDVAGSVKEKRHVKKSLARLGYLVNTLAKEPQSGKAEGVDYKSSCLTHLLRESLGGNSKLTVLCAISPDNNNDGEIFGTLRFGERVKCVRNEPVINEITEEDVNDLSDQIRQLKEELIRTKSSASTAATKHGYFQGRNVRDSLNMLRVSLNRSLLLPQIDNEPDDEINIDEKDVKELQNQLNELRKSLEDLKDQSCDMEESCETDLISEDGSDCFEEVQTDLKSSQDELLIDSGFRNSISISSSFKPAILQEPTMSESPKFGKNLRTSAAISSSFNAQNKPEVNQSEFIRSSMRSSKIFPGPAESLEASLQRGLEIIDHHQRNSVSVSNRSSMAFSFEHLTLQPCPEVDDSGSSGQTLLCSACKKQVNINDTDELQDSLKTWIVPIKEEETEKDEKKVLEQATTKEELETRCNEQAIKIDELNKLIDQYKNQESNAVHAMPIQSEIVPFDEELRNEGIHTEKKLEIVTESFETKEVQNESVFDANEKEALLNEIQTLRVKLQSQSDAFPRHSTDKLRSSLLSRSIQLRKSSVFQTLNDNNNEELDRERERWTEMESEWISLTDELRIDIEAHRRRAEKAEIDLKTEKNCTEELDDALCRAVLGHARMVEHYADLQEKYNELASRHRAMMEGVAELKRAAAIAAKKGQGRKFARSLAAELSAVRVEREKERDFLKKENKSLKLQLRDTAEAVHAAGELLVRLREAEHAASVAEENAGNASEENEKLKKQMEKVKRKHKMEIVTMKQYMAESRLPHSALPQHFADDSDVLPQSTNPDDDQAWRAEFGPIYQDHY